MTFNYEVTDPAPGLMIAADGTLHISASDTSSGHDFDFLMGEHMIYHRKLKERLIPVGTRRKTVRRDELKVI
jgi:hypothetical protein